jgi:hypothetical protein
LKQRVKIREIVIEALFPGTHKQSGRIYHGVELTQQIVPEGTDTEAELGQIGIPGMLPSQDPSAGDDEPER